MQTTYSDAGCTHVLGHAPHHVMQVCKSVRKWQVCGAVQVWRTRRLHAVQPNRRLLVNPDGCTAA